MLYPCFCWSSHIIGFYLTFIAFLRLYCHVHHFIIHKGSSCVSKKSLLNCLNLSHKKNTILMLLPYFTALLTHERCCANTVDYDFYASNNLLIFSEGADVCECRVCLQTLTLSSRGRLSLTAPMQPRQPITMTMAPTVMRRLAADREGREEERVAKFPCVTDSQTPTPRIPQPPNCERERERSREKENVCVKTVVKNSSQYQCRIHLY